MVCTCIDLDVGCACGCMHFDVLVILLSSCCHDKDKETGGFLCFTLVQTQTGFRLQASSASIARKRKPAALQTLIRAKDKGNTGRGTGRGSRKHEGFSKSEALHIVLVCFAQEVSTYIGRDTLHLHVN